MTTRVAVDDTGKASLLAGRDRAPHAVVPRLVRAFQGDSDQEVPLVWLEGRICGAIQQAGFASDPFRLVGVSPRLHSRRALGAYCNARLVPEDKGP